MNLKVLKRFSLLASTIACLSFPINTYASQKNSDLLPKDAKILYEDDNAVLYQTKTGSGNVKSPVDYESKWINSSTTGDSFPIYNNRSGECGVTWAVESSSNESYAQIWMSNSLGLPILNTRTVRPSDGEVVFRLKNSSKGYYTVHFLAHTTVGMRIMCWMYD